MDALWQLERIGFYELDGSDGGRDPSLDDVKDDPRTSVILRLSDLHLDHDAFEIR